MVAAAPRVFRIRDADGGGLQSSPALVATLLLTRLKGEDHTLHERHVAARGGLEVLGHRVHDLRPDHDVGLHGVIQALAAAGPVTVLRSCVCCGATLHVDQADLTALAPRRQERPMSRPDSTVANSMLAGNWVLFWAVISLFGCTSTTSTTTAQSAEISPGEGSGLSELVPAAPAL